MRILCLAAFVAFVSVFGTPHAGAFSPVSIRAGKIVNLRLVDSVAWNWNTDDYGPEPFLGSNEKFAVLTMTLSKGRSIGKYDYTLGGQRCLGMAVMQDPVDPSVWEQIYTGDFVEIKLVYKVDETASPWDLMFQLTSREPVLALTQDGVLNPLGGGGETAEPPAADGDGQGGDAGAAPWDVGDSEAPAPAESAPAPEAPAGDTGGAAAAPADEGAGEKGAADDKGGDSLLDEWQ